MRIFDVELRNKDVHVNTQMDPLTEFSTRLTRCVHQKLCIGLYDKDKLMVAFIIATKLLKESFKFEYEHLDFIIKGPCSSSSAPTMTQAEKDEREFIRQRNLKTSVNDPRRVKLQERWSWLTDKHWEGLERLNQIAPFKDPSIIQHMIDNPVEWD